MHQIIPVTHLTRFEKLGVALDRAGIKLSTIAAYLGVTAPSVGRMLKKDTIDPYRHNQLIKFGIPAELLPKPEFTAPGPKPQNHEALGEAA